MSDKDICQKFNISMEQVKTFRTIFNELDANDDQKLDKNELQTAMRQLGYGVNSKIINSIMNACDKDGDGHIEFDEFVAIVSSKIKTDGRKDDLKEIFDTLDRNHDGYISAKELQDAWPKVTGEKISKIEAKAIIASADENNDGKVNYNEFEHMWNE